VLTFGSLFAGIGGFDYGFERAGMRCVWQCEIDAYCIRVLEKHWPDVLRVRDIRQLRADDVPKVDVFCGGFPCQDISLAGKGAGIGGARSGLWSEYARLIGELRPRYVVVENVAALLARGLSVVLGDLAALGYDAEWDCIPASAVGAPHRRDRLWIVAYPARNLPAWTETTGTQRKRAWSGSESSREDSDSNRGRLQVGTQFDCYPQTDSPHGDTRGRHADGLRDEVADADCPRRAHAEGCPGSRAGGRSLVGSDDARSGAHHWSVEPNVGRVADGVPHRVDRLRALGNSLVPQIAEWIGERIVSYESLREAAWCPLKPPPIEGQTVIGPPCAWCHQTAELTVQIEDEREDARGWHAARMVPVCGPCEARVQRDGPFGMPMRRKARGVDQLEMFPSAPHNAVIGS
jgi:DNA (cytosine-5)-methyltransferase 1